MYREKRQEIHYCYFSCTLFVNYSKGLFLFEPPSNKVKDSLFEREKKLLQG